MVRDLDQANIKTQSNNQSESLQKMMDSTQAAAPGWASTSATDAKPKPTPDARLKKAIPRASATSPTSLKSASAGQTCDLESERFQLGALSKQDFESWQSAYEKPGSQQRSLITAPHDKPQPTTLESDWQQIKELSGRQSKISKDDQACPLNRLLFQKKQGLYHQVDFFLPGINTSTKYQICIALIKANLSPTAQKSEHMAILDQRLADALPLPADCSRQVKLKTLTARGHFKEVLTPQVQTIMDSWFSPSKKNTGGSRHQPY